MFFRSMPDERIAGRVRALLAYYSGASEDSLRSDSTPQNTQGWDSAANLYLVAAIEEEFGVTIATRDAIKLQSVGALAAYLETHATRESPG